MAGIAFVSLTVALGVLRDGAPDDGLQWALLTVKLVVLAVLVGALVRGRRRGGRSAPRD